jgi:peptidoglycan hydrolase-like protein with peptidoglycan-binding domain
MKRFVLILLVACLAGLFVASQGIGAQHRMGGSSDQGGNQMMNQSNQSGSAQMMHQGQQMATTALNLNREQVREMQTLLNQKGYSVGQADGIIGQRTQNALRQFQESEGLTHTGTPTPETIRALAPSTQQQEFFGLSPAYNQQEQNQMKNQTEEQNQMKNQNQEQNQMQNQ